MNKELTLKVVKRFPVLYQDFYSSVQETCMCWGFEHGDGWFDIIWQLSLALEDELGYSWLQEKRFLFAKKYSKKWNNFIYKLSPPVRHEYKMEGKGIKGDPYRRVMVKEDKPRLPFLKKLIWFPNTGFKVDQVKEKFGTLRFYSPGNDRIYKLIAMAERLSEVTCEICGKRGKLRTEHGWYSVTCKDCENERNNKSKS